MNTGPLLPYSSLLLVIFTGSKLENKCSTLVFFSFGKHRYFLCFKALIQKPTQVNKRLSVDFSGLCNSLLMIECNFIDSTTHSYIVCKEPSFSHVVQGLTGNFGKFLPVR